MRTIALAIVLAAACFFALSLWFNTLSQESISASRSYQPQEVDYQIKGFEAVIFDAKGQASQRMQGHTLRHFPFDDRHEIDAPKGQTLQGLDRWKIQSDTAKSSQGLGELHWQGNVNIQQSGKQALNMQSDYLLQQPREQLASTEQGVVVNASASKITAQAMQLHTGTNQLNLKGQVKSVYHVQ